MSTTSPKRIDRRKQAQRDEAANEAVTGRRSPPHDAAAERSVLAAICWSPTARARAFEQLDERHFYLPQHQRIWNALDALNAENREIDALIIKDKLQIMGLLEDAGGEAFVDEVITTETSGLHIGEYIEILLNQNIARRLNYLALEVLADVQAGGALPTDILDGASQSLMEIGVDRLEDKNVDLAGPLDRMFAEMQQAAKDGYWIVPAQPTHYPTLDKKLEGGFKPGEFIVVAARPGVGKSTFMLNMTRKIIGHGRIPDARDIYNRPPLGIWSLEMTEKQLTDNLVAAYSGVDARLVKNRTFFTDARNVRDVEAYANVLAAMGELKQHVVKLEMTPGLNVRKLGAQLKRYVRNPGIKVAFIDYLQLMTPVKPANSRQEDVAGISTALKRLALELNISIVVLSQLNRGPESRSSAEPHLSDLRESGAIEQDADVVMMLYREDRDSKLNIVRVRIAKNRNGPTTVGDSNLQFKFNAQKYLMEEIQADEYEE